MGHERAKWLLIMSLAIVCIGSAPGAPVPKSPNSRNKNFHPEILTDEKAHAKSYIDIDASDPFKVPKSSQYIDQPVPEFSRGSKEKEEQDESEEKGPPPKSIDNIQDDLKHLGLENVGKENVANGDQGSKPDIPEDSPAAEQAPEESMRSQGGDDEPPQQESENAAGIKPAEADMSNNIDPNTLKSGDTRQNVPDGSNDEGPREGGDQPDGDQEN